MTDKVWQMLLDRGLAYAIAAGGVVLGFRWAWIRLDRWKEAEPEKAPAQHLCLGCPRGQDEERPEAAELASHRFFAYMRHAILTTIPTLPIREPGRRALAVDFLTLKFEASRDAFHRFVTQPGIEGMSSTELADALLLCIDSIIRTYEGRAVELATRKNGVPAMMVYVGRFREIHMRAVEEARDHIEATCTSGWLGDDPVVKTAAVLDYMVSVFRRTLADAERTLGRLNGQLSCLEYDGITIGPCPASIGYGSGAITVPVDLATAWPRVEERMRREQP